MPAVARPDRGSRAWRESWRGSIPGAGRSVNGARPGRPVSRRHPPPVATLRLRLSTLALVVASSIVLVGLLLALRELSKLEGEARQADLSQASAILAGRLRSSTETLGVLEPLYLYEATPSPARFRELLTGLPEQLRHFQRIWIADSAGRLIAEEVRTEGMAPLPERWDIDEEERYGLGELAQRARRSRQPVVSHPVLLSTGDTGLVSIRPVVLDGELRGFIGGSSPLAELLPTLDDLVGAQQGPQYALLLDTLRGDTVLARGDPGVRGDSVIVVPVALPDGGSWVLRGAYPPQTTLHLQILLVAIAAVSAMVVGVLHERRQLQRIAERSRELEHLSQELLRVNRAKSEFLANVSHELRTPLTAIVGFAELLKDGVYGALSPRQTGPVERIEASAAHLRQLVDQVLDLAKMAAGRLEVHPELVDVRQLVLDVATELEPLVSERGLALTLGIGSVPRVRTDPTHLRQILVNLVGNAAKFTPAGSVTVRARLVTPAGGGHEVAGLRQRAPDATATWVALQVVDTGIGIAPKDHERVFDEFEQVNAGARSDSDRRGTGLGLPISRRLARLLGGDLTLESVPGKGSTFTLWIPVDGKEPGDGAKAAIEQA